VPDINYRIAFQAQTSALGQTQGQVNRTSQTVDYLVGSIRRAGAASATFQGTLNATAAAASKFSANMQQAAAATAATASAAGGGGGGGGKGGGGASGAFNNFGNAIRNAGSAAAAAVGAFTSLAGAMAGVAVAAGAAAAALARLAVGAVTGAMSGLISAATAVAGAFMAAATAAARFALGIANVGRAAIATASQLAGLAGLAGTAIFFVAAKSAAQFQEQMAIINTIMRGTPQQTRDVGNALLDMAVKSGQSTSDMTASFYDLLSAGIGLHDGVVKVAEVNAALKASTNLAIGGLSSEKEAVNLIVFSLNAFGLAANKAGAVSDYFSKAVEVGVVTASQIAHVIANIAPIAAGAHIGIDEVATSFGFLTARGFSAAKAATAMSRSIIELEKPHKSLIALQQKVHKNYLAIAQEKGLSVALQTMRDDAAKTGVKFVDLFGRVEAYRFAEQVTDEVVRKSDGTIVHKTHSNEDYLKTLDQIRGSTAGQGNAAEQAARRGDTLDRNINKLKSSFYALAVAIGTPLLAPLNSFVKSMLGITTSITNWARANQAFLKTWAPVLAAVSGLLALSAGIHALFLALTLVAPALGTTGRALLGVTLDIEKLLGPIALVAGALILFKTAVENNVGGMGKFKGNLKDLQTVIDGVVTSVRDIFYAFQFLFSKGQDPGKVFERLGQRLGEVFAKVTPAFQRFIGFIIERGRAIVAWVGTLLPDIAANLLAIGSAILAWAIQVAPSVISGIQEALGALIGWVASIWPSIQTHLSNLITNITSWITTNGPTIATNLGKWTDKFVTWAEGVWDSITTPIAEFFKKFTDWISNPDNQNQIKTALASWATAIGDWLNGVWGTITANAKNLIDGFTGWISNNDNQQQIKTSLENWAKAISDWLNNAWDTVKANVSPLINGFTSWISNTDNQNQIKKSLESWGKAIGDWLSSAWSGLTDKVGEFASDFGGWLHDNKIIEQATAAGTFWGGKIVGGIILAPILLAKWIYDNRDNIGNAFVDAGQSAVEGIAKGIRQLATENGPLAGAAAALALVLGGLIAAKLATNVVSGLLSKLPFASTAATALGKLPVLNKIFGKTGGAAAGALGGVASTVAGAVPVTVTNWPPNFGGANPTSLAGAAGEGGFLGIGLGGLAAIAGVLAIPLTLSLLALPLVKPGGVTQGRTDQSSMLTPVVNPFGGQGDNGDDLGTRIGKSIAQNLAAGSSPQGSRDGLSGINSGSNLDSIVQRLKDIPVFGKPAAVAIQGVSQSLVQPDISGAQHDLDKINQTFAATPSVADGAGTSLRSVGGEVVRVGSSTGEVSDRFVAMTSNVKGTTADMSSTVPTHFSDMQSHSIGYTSRMATGVIGSTEKMSSQAVDAAYIMAHGVGEHAGAMSTAASVSARNMSQAVNDHATTMAHNAVAKASTTRKGVSSHLDTMATHAGKAANAAASAVVDTLADAAGPATDNAYAIASGVIANLKKIPNAILTIQGQLARMAKAHASGEDISYLGETGTLGITTLVDTGKALGIKPVRFSPTETIVPHDDPPPDDTNTPTGGGGGGKGSKGGKGDEKSPLEKALEVAKNAADLAEALQKIAGLDIGKMVKTSMGKIAKAMLLAEQITYDITKGFGKARLQKVADFSDAASKIVGFLGSAADAFVKVQDFKTVDRKKIASVTNDIHYAVLYIESVAKKFKDNNLLAKASIFADTATKVVSLIGTAYDAFSKIDTVKPVSKKAFNEISLDIDEAVNSVAHAALQVSPKQVSAAGIFAEGATKAVSLIGAGYDAFVKIQDYKGVAKETFNSISSDIAEAVNAVAHASKDLSGVATAAGKFADDATKSVSLIGSAYDAFSKIDSEYIPVTQGTFDALTASVKQAVIAVKGAADAVGQGVAKNAGEFADNATKSVALIGSAFDSFSKVLDFQPITPVQMDALVDNIILAVKTLHDRTKDLKISAKELTEEGGFADTAGKILGAIKTAMDVFGGTVVKDLAPDEHRIFPVLDDIFNNMQAPSQG
jgi:TP901 family phage tail tape measure protein